MKHRTYPLGWMAFHTVALFVLSLICLAGTLVQTARIERLEAALAAKGK